MEEIANGEILFRKELKSTLLGHTVGWHETDYIQNLLLVAVNYLTD